MEIKTPFVKDAVGAGDLVKAALSSVGIEQSKEGGCGCRKRQEALNRALSFKPAAPPPRTDLWTVPPHMPEGFRLHRECFSPRKIIRLFVNETTGASVILDVVGDKYSNYRGFCCGPLRGRAEQVWEEACRLL